MPIQSTGGRGKRKRGYWQPTATEQAAVEVAEAAQMGCCLMDIIGCLFPIGCLLPLLIAFLIVGGLASGHVRTQKSAASPVSRSLSGVHAMRGQDFRSVPASPELGQAPRD